MILITFAIIAVFVKGHGYISQPKATYKDPSTMTNYITTIDANQMFNGIKWNGSPQENSEQYQILLQTNKTSTLKKLFISYVNGCPKNNIDNVVDVSNIDSFHWQNDQYREGFISSHSGPCEIWFDDTPIMNEVDCAAKYKSYPAIINVDYKKCKAPQCLLSFYWLALHEPQWQLYKGCVTIKGYASDANNDDANQYIKYNGTLLRCVPEQSP